MQKVPYMAECGKREVETRKTSVRRHEVGEIGLLTTDELIKNIQDERN